MRRSLAAQLRLGLAAGILLILGVSGTIWWIVLEFRQDMDYAHEVTLRAATQLPGVRSALWELRWGLIEYTVASPEAQKQLLADENKWYAFIDEQLASYDSSIGDAEERRVLTGLRSAYQRYRQARPRFFELWQAGAKEEAMAWRARTTTAFGKEAVRALDALIALQRTVSAERQAEDMAEVELAFGLVIAITIALLGTLVIGYIHAARSLRPIRALHQQALRLVREQLGETLNVTGGGNEVTALVESFQLMSGRLLAHTEALRRSGERLDYLLRAKSEFMNSVTHELRTPLNSVIGFAELLREEVPGPLNEKQAAFVADILASGRRLLALVEGILEMSRLDVAGAALEREPVEIGAVLQELVLAQRDMAEARGLTLRLDIAAETGSAELDPRALRRMLDALLDNAIKFSRDGGAVAVGARRADGVLEIAVTDTGIGIAGEDLPKLFQPFAQLDAGLARQHAGTGMGLALARRLAEQQGGTIEVESELGKGSTFTLRLPLWEKS